MSSHQEQQPATTLTEEEISRYDRQIRLWGIEAQQRLMSTFVWLFGVDPISMESGKNLAAAGVNMVVVDDRPYTGQLVSVIPKENMFKPMPTNSAWFMESLRQMNDVILLKTRPEVYDESQTELGRNWAVGRIDNVLLTDKRWNFGNYLLYSVTTESVEIWSNPRDASVNPDQTHCELEPSEAAIIGGLIAQCITNKIANREEGALTWQKIVYDRAKMCAHTIQAETKTEIKSTIPSDAVEID